MPRGHNVDMTILSAFDNVYRARGLAYGFYLSKKRWCMVTNLLKIGYLVTGGTLFFILLLQIDIWIIEAKNRANTASNTSKCYKL